MTLRALVERGGALFTAWSTVPDPLVAELLARSGYDTVTLDMQHGSHSTESVLRGIAAVELAGLPALVRIPLARWDMASRVLDFGASAVIAPMVNSIEDARAFAAATKYPPLGERSWGPTRAMTLKGQDDPQMFLEAANRDTMAIAMAETLAGLAVLDAALEMDGIDGVFVGPSDLSIALSGGARVNARDAETLKAAEGVAAKARSAGKLSCAFASRNEDAHRYVDMGFGLIAVSTDVGCLRQGASALLAGLKG